MNCRPFLLLAVTFFVTTIFEFSHTVKADEEVQEDSDVSRAIVKGLKFLASQQKPDGSFSSDGSFTIAETALTGVAFLASGSTPKSGEYADVLKNILNYYLNLYRAKDKPDRWYINADSGKSRMHGHGYALLFLSLVYGEYSTDFEGYDEFALLKRAINAAIKKSEESQTEDGGWAYEPNDSNHEGTITVCVLLGLRAVRDIGFHVSKRTIEKAIKYIRDSVLEEKDTVSFKYSLHSNDFSRDKGFPLTAAALSALQATGTYGEEKDQDIRRIYTKGIEFLKRNTPPFDQTNNWYGHFHAAQAFFLFVTDEHSNEEYVRHLDWFRWKTKIFPDLINSQINDGSWKTQGGNTTPIFSTAIATFILALQYQYIPAFQR